MSAQIHYEHPLNERVRLLLRLEFLFRQCRHFMGGTSSWDSRGVLTTFNEILALFSRGDLKNELIKELERNSAGLTPLATAPGVNQEQLGNILRWLGHLTAALHKQDGQLGQALRNDEFLTAVRQRFTIPGGSCDFDLPQYHHWLTRPYELRSADQERWLETLDPVRQTVELLLKLIRNSADASYELASGGNFESTLDPGAPYQLIRIGLPEKVHYFPEISGGKHRIAVRFLAPAPNGGRAKPVGEDVSFNLTCCIL